MGRLSDKLSGEDRVAKVVLDRIQVPLNGTVKINSLPNKKNTNIHSSNSIPKNNYERTAIKVEDESPRVSARLKNRKKKFSVKQLLAGVRDDSPESRVELKVSKSPPPLRPTIKPPPSTPIVRALAAPQLRPRQSPSNTRPPQTPPQTKAETPTVDKKKSERFSVVPELDVGPEITVTRVKRSVTIERALKVKVKEEPRGGPPPLVKIKKILKGGVERPEFKEIVIGGGGAPPTRDEVLIRRVDPGLRPKPNTPPQRKDVVTISQRPKKRPPPNYQTLPNTLKLEDEEEDGAELRMKKKTGSPRMNGKGGGEGRSKASSKDTFEKYFITKRRICEHNDSLESESEEGEGGSASPLHFAPPSPQPKESSSIYELMSEVSLELPAWNLHILSDTESFCLAHVSRGPVGIPVMKKLIEIDTDYNAKVYVNQTFRAEFRGVYDSYESIKKLILEVDKL